MGQLAAFVEDDVLELEVLELERCRWWRPACCRSNRLEPLDDESDLAAGWSDFSDDFSDDFSPLAGAAAEVLAVARIGPVEAAALEHHADRAVDLAQLAAAHRARGQRVVGECLHGLEAVAARGAGVLIGGHGVLRTAVRQVIWIAPAGWWMLQIEPFWHSNR